MGSRREKMGDILVCGCSNILVMSDVTSFLVKKKACRRVSEQHFGDEDILVLVMSDVPTFW